MARFSASLLLVALGLMVGCDANPEQPPLGSMDITTSAPAAAGEITSADGWVVKLDRFLVHVTAVNVAGDDRVLAASATPQIIDQVAAGSKSLLTAGVRTARPWEAVSFQIGPALPDTDTTVLEPVTDADRTMMETDAVSIYAEGKATKGAVVKTFKLGLKTDTLYAGCEENRNGVVVRGLVVPAGGNDTADIVMDPTVIFSEDLAGAGPISIEPFVQADRDVDGTITMAELRAAPLTGGRFASASGGVVDLGAFVEALGAKVVKTFRASGSCIATAPAAP